MTLVNDILPTDSARSLWLRMNIRQMLSPLAFGLLGLTYFGGCSPAPPRDPPATPVEQVEPVEVEPVEGEPVRPAEPTEPAESRGRAGRSDAEDGDLASDPLIDPRPLQMPAEADPQPIDVGSGRDPAELAAEKAFAAPQQGRQLTPEARLWIDPERGRLIVDGYVTLREGALEMFACPVGTKEHESVVSVLARSRYVHAGLLAIGAMPGTPVSFTPEYRPATGQRIAIWVMWRDEEGEIQKVPAQQWVQHTGTEDPLQSDWVFAGSSFWRDPETGQEFYQADSGDLVCVSNFSTATLDLPVESSQSNAALQYSAFTANIPPRGTPVRLVFVPVPLPADEPDPAAADLADPRVPPEDELLEEPITAESSE